MANEEQLALLRQGVSAWHKWRLNYPHAEIYTDLTNANLRGTNLREFNLFDAQLTNANLSNADLSNANLNSADLSNANLSNANLSNANLSNANLSNANLSNANLDHTNLRHTSIYESTKIDDKWRLVHVLINQGGTGRDLRQADLSNADLRSADLSNADLRKGNFSNADLRSANLSNTNLSNANLSNANLEQTNLRNTHLDETVKIDDKWRLIHVLVNQGGTSRDLRQADLSNADLRRINFCNADLRDTNLSNADLSFANLSNTNLSNTNLSKANLNNTDMRGTYFDEATKIDDKWKLVHALVNQGGVGRDLHQADLNDANLTTADLSKANLSNANLSYANLSNANLTTADLSDANLSNANLGNANLSNANLRGTHIDAATKIIDKWRLVHTLVNQSGGDKDLSRADLSDANLTKTDFSNANLSNANLSNSNLTRANFRNTNLRFANLRNANLNEMYVLYTDFLNATLTGACIVDWHINNSTKLDGVICDYIYRTIDEEGRFSGRLPIDPNSTFAPGEFTQRFQILESALETIDITFTEGIDWQAFFRSFQELRSQNPDTDISIQGMERKAEGFIVRLEVNQEADKATIETQAKQLYAEQLQLLEAQYEERLRLQGAHLEDIQELLSFERQERTRLSKVVETMASEQQSPKYDLRGAQFAGGFAEVVKGNQFGGTINNYGQNTDDIVRLLTSLRDMAQEFPEAQREEVQVHLEDLAADLDQPEKCQPARLKTRIVGLFGVLLMLGRGVATATDFANNVLELSEKLDVTTETFQPQLEKFKQIYPEFDWYQK